MCFNTQPPEGGCWLPLVLASDVRIRFQHTAARRRLQIARAIDGLNDSVSTHSRPKAAAALEKIAELGLDEFQHTAARRRLQYLHGVKVTEIAVSTHSRPKAAAFSTPAL